MNRPITVCDDGAGDAERSELGRAEMTDDGGVGEQEERFGDESGERRNGEPGDLAVLGRCRVAATLDRCPSGVSAGVSPPGRWNPVAKAFRWC